MSTNAYFGKLLNPPPGATFSGNSVEWIMEAPGGGYPSNYILPQFTPVNFTDCLASGGTQVANPTNGVRTIIAAGNQPKTSVALANMAVTIDWLQS